MIYIRGRRVRRRITGTERRKGTVTEKTGLGSGGGGTSRGPASIASGSGRSTGSKCPRHVRTPEPSDGEGPSEADAAPSRGPGKKLARQKKVKRQTEADAFFDEIAKVKERCSEFLRPLRGNGGTIKQLTIRYEKHKSHVHCPAAAKPMIDSLEELAKKVEGLKSGLKTTRKDQLAAVVANFENAVAGCEEKQKELQEIEATLDRIQKNCVAEHRSGYMTTMGYVKTLTGKFKKFWGGANFSALLASTIASVEEAMSKPPSPPHPYMAALAVCADGGTFDYGRVTRFPRGSKVAVAFQTYLQHNGTEVEQVKVASDESFQQYEDWGHAITQLTPLSGVSVDFGNTAVPKDAMQAASPTLLTYRRHRVRMGSTQVPLTGAGAFFMPVTGGDAWWSTCTKLAPCLRDGVLVADLKGHMEMPSYEQRLKTSGDVAVFQFGVGDVIFFPWGWIPQLVFKQDFAGGKAKDEWVHGVHLPAYYPKMAQVVDDDVMQAVKKPLSAYLEKSVPEHVMFKDMNEAWATFHEKLKA